MSDTLYRLQPGSLPERLRYSLLRLYTQLAPAMFFWAPERRELLRLQTRHLRRQRRWPNIDGPRTFNENLLRLCWLERHSPLRGFVTDKEFVKDWAAMRCPGIGTPETFAVLRGKAEIDAFDFPERCVIKPTHLSGPIVIRRSGEDIDRAEIAGWLHSDYFRRTREHNYRGLEPKIIVEELLGGEFDEVPYDYKVFCFFGRAKMIQVDIGRYHDHARRYYTSDWQDLPFTTLHPRHSESVARPAVLERMIEQAEKLAAPFSHIRADLYVIGDKIFLGIIYLT